MRCSDSRFDSRPLTVPDGAWAFYDALIREIPDDVAVRGACVGGHWCYVEAECGMGVAFSTKGGAPRSCKSDLRGMTLREVAELAKSWSFPEASLGVAALNAWYSQEDKVAALGASFDDPVELPDGTVRKMDAFQRYRDAYAGKDVVVVGHFPHLERVAEIAGSLTVLERNPAATDLPDPACEYTVPYADFVFMTGTTLINKTAPRLISLAQDARTIMVGPSSVPAPTLLDAGVDALAGCCVVDPDRAKCAVMQGTVGLFGQAARMFTLERAQA